MITSIDIAFCLDCSLSMSFHLEPIRRSMLSTLRQMTNVHGSSVRTAMIKFQSHCDQWRTHSHPFTSSIDTFEQWIPIGPLTGDNSDEKKAIVDALDQSISLGWRPDNSNHRYHEKMVILITDGSPCNLLSNKCPCDSPDLWKMADELAKKNITLVVLGIEPSVICDAFYYALAKKTGGQYFPFINGARVLPNLMLDAMLGENTFRQLFGRLDVHMDIERDSLFSHSTAVKWADEMYKYCHTIADIRRLFYPYLDRMNERLINEVSVETNNWKPDVEPGSPPPGTNYVDLWSRLRNSTYTSLGITDDDDYRSRMPTMVRSPNTNLISPIYSQRPINSFDLGSDSEVDDENIRPNNNGKFDSTTSNTQLIYHRSAPDINIFSSTPVTDDEGYRTRLPTTASTDTSFTHAVSTPSYTNSYYGDSDGEIDYDEVF
ncbi:hypothetical protein I4U23_028070 [Adineta vaga]|nr:hypothetical protein I4U23_028070 [Adineta vaga]